MKTWFKLILLVLFLLILATILGFPKDVAGKIGIGLGIALVVLTLFWGFDGAFERGLSIFAGFSLAFVSWAGMQGQSLVETYALSKTEPSTTTEAVILGMNAQFFVINCVLIAFFIAMVLGFFSWAASRDPRKED